MISTEALVRINSCSKRILVERTDCLHFIIMSIDTASDTPDVRLHTRCILARNLTRHTPVTTETFSFVTFVRLNSRRQIALALENLTSDIRNDTVCFTKDIVKVMSRYVRASLLALYATQRHYRHFRVMFTNYEKDADNFMRLLADFRRNDPT